MNGNNNPYGNINFSPYGPSSFNLSPYTTPFSPAALPGYTPPPMPAMGSGGGGGGGWMDKALGVGTALAPLGGPLGIGLAGLQLFGGVLGAIAKSKRRKKARKAYEQQQGAYQSKAAQLFPELGKQTFQFTEPRLDDAIRQGLALNLSRFANWGVPPNMATGANPFIQSAQNLPGPQMPVAPAGPARKTGGTGGRRGRGERSGWGQDFQARKGNLMI